ncbi:MAG TPA: FecR domain-containing protein [Verrucomicrobiae bacterium]|jgi:hypothetical protein
MKFTRFLSLATICGLFFSICASSFAQDKPGSATVVRITGEVRFSIDNGANWKPMVVGQVLVAGDVVETATDGSVDFVLGGNVPKHVVQRPDEVAPAADSGVRGMSGYQSTAEQNIIHMDSGTVLAIDKLTVGDTGVDAVSDTQLDLRQGTIFGNVKKLSATSQYLIKMPNGIAGVRGTSFLITIGGNITVIHGSMVVSFTNSQGQTTTSVLTPGDSYNIFTGQVSQLTPQQLAREEHHLHLTITLEYGVLTFVFDNDRTTIYISPTSGT